MSIAAASLLRGSGGALRRYYQQLPCLLLSSPDNPESRYLYNITGNDRKPIAFSREIHLPQIAGRHLLGSSQGFLFSVDPIGEIHATDPFTGARLSVPSTAALPNMVGVVRDPDTGNLTHYISDPHNLVDPDPPGNESIFLTGFDGVTGSVLASKDFDPSKVHVFPLDYMSRTYFSRAILSPSLDTVVVIHLGLYGCHRNHLAFSRIGGSSWTALRSPKHCFNDVIFHKGRLHAIDVRGTLYAFDDDLDNPTGPPLRSRNRPLLGEDCSLSRLVVESPDGEELFLVFRDLGDDEPPRTQLFKVYKLDKASYKWKRVKNIGDLALFLGFNHSISLSASDYPDLIKPNCIYFTDVYRAGYMDCPHWVGDTGVYSLKDGSIRFYELRDGSEQLHWPPPVWFMPPTR